MFYEIDGEGVLDHLATLTDLFKKLASICCAKRVTRAEDFGFRLYVHMGAYVLLSNEDLAGMKIAISLTIPTAFALM